MMRSRFLWVLLLAVVALPGPAPAQDVRVTVQPRRGWVGVSIDFTQVGVGEVARAAAVVEAVTPGSPAEEAGVRVGDTITHIDGQAVTQRVLDALRVDLDPGDMVRLTLRREGRSREVLVEAAPWPADQQIQLIPNERVVLPNMGEVVIRIDSVRGAILQNLDSLALTFQRVERDSLGSWSMQVFRAPRSAGWEEGGTWEFTYPPFLSPFDSLRLSPEVLFVGPEAILPFETFETFVVRTPSTDSIRTGIERLRRSLTEVRRSELARIRELGAERGHLSEESLQADRRIQELRGREEALAAEMQALQERLRAVSESEMKRQWAEVQARTQEALEQGRTQALRLREQNLSAEEQLRRQREMEEEVYTPGRIIAIGQSFILGAQLQALNPELAEYFGVDRGVLVTDVVDGTPAAAAGFRGGDIIVRLGGDPVTSLEDLRFFVGYLEGPLQVGVIRKGTPVELVVRR